MKRWLLTAVAALFLLFLGSQAANATTCSVPNTFVNNTVADGDQVNANFTAILSCFNTLLSGTLTSGAYCYYSGSVITCDTGTAWTSYTPTISCASGTLTTVGLNTGQWKRVGKIIHVRVQVHITTNGTCAGALIASMPTTTVQQSLSFNTGDMVGAVANGAILRGECCLTGTQNMYIYKYDGTYPGADGAIMSVSGTYEAS